MFDDVEVFDGDVLVEHGKLALVPVGVDFRIPDFALGLATLYQVQPGGMLQVSINADEVDGTILDVTMFKRITNKWLTANDERYVGNVITGPAGRVLVCDPALIISHLNIDLNFPDWWQQFECADGMGLLINLEIADWLDISEDYEKIEIFVRDDYGYFGGGSDGGEEEYVKDAEEVLGELERTRCGHTHFITQAHTLTVP